MDTKKDAIQKPLEFLHFSNHSNERHNFIFENKRVAPSFQQKYDGVERVFGPRVGAQRHNEVVQAVTREVGCHDDGAIHPVVLFGVLEAAVLTGLQHKFTACSVTSRCQGILKHFQKAAIFRKKK